VCLDLGSQLLRDREPPPGVKLPQPAHPALVLPRQSSSRHRHVRHADPELRRYHTRQPSGRQNIPSRRSAPEANELCQITSPEDLIQTTEKG
jgi:hypothetical protein